MITAHWSKSSWSWLAYVCTLAYTLTHMQAATDIVTAPRPSYEPPPKHTPWGAWDYCRQLAPGIFTVGTPSHGGIFVSKALNMTIPAAVREDSRWYEEDCDWAIPFTFLGDAIRANANGEHAEYTIKSLDAAEENLRGWNPTAWELFYGRKLMPGESRMKDDLQWHTDNQGKLEVVHVSWKHHVDRSPQQYPGVVLAEDEVYIEAGPVLVGGKWGVGQRPLTSYKAKAADYETVRGPFGCLIADIASAVPITVC